MLMPERARATGHSFLPCLCALFLELGAVGLCPAESVAIGCQMPEATATFTLRTRVSKTAQRWCLNGQVTYRGTRAEGLLLNVRMVNSVFEDRHKPDFDPEANTNRFLLHLTDYAAHGIRAFTICLQGGRPRYEGEVNQRYPFRFEGARDDPVVYAKLKELTSPRSAPASDSNDYFPPPESQGGWRKLNDTDSIRTIAGMDPDKLTKLRAWLRDSDQRGFAAVVIRHGYLVLEEERRVVASPQTALPIHPIPCTGSTMRRFNAECGASNSSLTAGSCPRG